MYTLTEADRAFFDENGYLLVRGALPADLCARVIGEGWQFLEQRCQIQRDDPGTWEQWPLSQHGFSEAWCLPSMWAMREDPTLHGVFAQLLDDQKLWVSVDRLGWKRPAALLDQRGRTVSKRSWNRNPYLHLDINPFHRPWWRVLQGAVALNRNDEAAGCFACVPGFHHDIAAWAEAQRAAGAEVPPPDRTFNRVYDADVQARLKPIGMEVGDLCVWDCRLPHTSMRNVSDRWRHSFYARYFEADPAHPDAAWHRQVMQDVQNALLKGERPRLFAMRGVVPQERADIEKEGYAPPALTGLGRRLTGLDPW